MHDENGVEIAKKLPVEICRRLTIKQFGKQLLRQVNYLNSTNDIITKGVRGKFRLLLNKDDALYISFEVDLTKTPPTLIIAGSKDPMQIGGALYQEIGLELQTIRWGVRWYFLCRCGRRCNTLYLPPGGKVFSCRNCHNLTYLTHTINKNTNSGLHYYTLRKMKLLWIKQAMDRMSYNGQNTKRAERYLEMAGKLERSFSEDVKNKGNQHLREWGCEV